MIFSKTFGGRILDGMMLIKLSNILCVEPKKEVSKAATPKPEAKKEEPKKKVPKAATPKVETKKNEPNKK